MGGQGKGKEPSHPVSVVLQYQPVQVPRSSPTAARALTTLMGP